MTSPSYHTFDAVPTTYKGIDFRSQLEAQWAAFFELWGAHRWEFEPCKLKGWFPDFALEGWAWGVTLVECKPLDIEADPPPDLVKKMRRGSPPDVGLLIVGREAQDHHVGWIAPPQPQNQPSLWWVRLGLKGASGLWVQAKNAIQWKPVQPQKHEHQGSQVKICPTCGGKNNRPYYECWECATRYKASHEAQVLGRYGRPCLACNARPCGRNWATCERCFRSFYIEHGGPSSGGWSRHSKLMQALRDGPLSKRELIDATGLSKSHVEATLRDGRGYFEYKHNAWSLAKDWKLRHLLNVPDDPAKDIARLREMVDSGECAGVREFAVRELSARMQSHHSDQDM